MPDMAPMLRIPFMLEFPMLFIDPVPIKLPMLLLLMLFIAMPVPIDPPAGRLKDPPRLLVCWAWDAPGGGANLNPEPPDPVLAADPAGGGGSENDEPRDWLMLGRWSNDIDAMDEPSPLP